MGDQHLQWMPCTVSSSFTNLPVSAIVYKMPSIST
jgi:hypothetical protein